jgi:hypothetical protein
MKPQTSKSSLIKLLLNALKPNHRLPAYMVAELRQKILQYCPPFRDPELTSFVETAFALDEMVESYFFPLLVDLAAGPYGAATSRLTSKTTTVTPVYLIPYEQAHLAGLSAQTMGIMRSQKPFERQLAYLATLLYPGALFVNRHPAFVYCPLGLPESQVTMRYLRHEILDPALKHLGPAHGDTELILKALLGIKQDDQLTQAKRIALAPQIATLGTAVNLAKLDVSATWNSL